MNRHNFKVWDINKRVFIPNDVYAIIPSNDDCFGVMLKDWEDYKEGEYFYPYAQTLVFPTGLTDKKGVDIYEGDVIYFQRGYVDDSHIDFMSGLNYMIVYANGSFRPYNPHKRYELGFAGSRDGRMDHYEVIGNVFESPELLNK